MVAEETVTDLTNDLLACRACLATKTKLFKLSENDLMEALEDIVGNPIFETFDMPQHLCQYCMDSVQKFIRFRDRCRRAQDLLDEAVLSGKDITNEFLESIDRIQHKLGPDLIQTNTLTIDTIARLREEIFDGPGPYGTIAKKYYKDSNMIDEVRDYSDDDEDDERKKVTTEEHYEPMCVQNIVYYGDKGKIDLPNFNYDNDGDDNNNDDNNNDDGNDDETTPVTDDKDATLKKETKDMTTEEKAILRWENRVNKLKSFCSENNLELTALSQAEQERAVAELREHTASHSDHGCTHCGKPFRCMENLQRHMKAEHDPAYNYVCTLCLVRRKSPIGLAQHLMEHMYKMTCKIHDYSAHNITTMKAHLQNHEDQLDATKRKCDYCEKTLNKRDYYIHLRTNHNAQLKDVCRYCGQLFVEARGLAMHIRLSHKDITNSEHVCTKCKAQFASVDALRRHNVNAGNTESCGEHPCVRCGAALPAVGLLRLHLLQHHLRGLDLSEFACERCGTEFNCARALTQHKLVESCEEYHSCPQCGAACASPELLAAHGNDQHAPTDLSCDSCGRMFKHLTFLTAHYKECIKEPDPEARRKKYGHQRLLGERRWGVQAAGGALQVQQVGGAARAPPKDGVMCDVCGLLCAKSAIRLHMYRHRAVEKLRCDECGRGFRNKQLLTDHMNSHTGAKPFKCKYCEKTFGARGVLARHQQRHTGLRPHICHICEKSFVHSTDVKSHIKHVHMKVGHRPRNRNPGNVGTKARINVDSEDQEIRQEKGKKQVKKMVILGPDGNPMIVGPDTIILRQDDGNKIMIEPNGAIEVQVLGEDGQFTNYDGSNDLVIEPDFYPQRPKLKVKRKVTKPAVIKTEVKEKRMTKGMKRPKAEFLTQNLQQLEPIGAIERIRNIKDSFVEYQEASNDDYVDFPPDDYSNGIPEDYAETDYQNINYASGKFATGGKRAPDPFISYDEPSTSHRYSSGGKYAPQSSSLSHRSSLGGKYVPQSTTATHRPSLGGKYVPQSTTSTHRPSLGGKYVPQSTSSTSRPSLGGKYVPHSTSRSPTKYTGGKRKPEIYSDISQYSYGEDMGQIGDRGRKRKSGKHMPIL